MCLMRKYYGTCEVTIEQRHAAYKDDFIKSIVPGGWPKEKLVELFPRDRAKMTLEEVRAFVNGIAEA